MAMSDQTLAVRLELIAAEYNRGLQQATRSIDRWEANTRSAAVANNQLNASMQRTAGVSRRTTAALQNVGFQVQDIAVQMAAGTSATRALSQQLPQLLGGFGLVGVAIGTLTAVGLPLLSKFLGQTATSAEEAEEALEELGERAGEAELALRAFLSGVSLREQRVLDRILEIYDEILDNEEEIQRLEEQRSSGYARRAQRLREVNDQLQEQADTYETDMQEAIDRVRQAEEQRAEANRINEGMLALQSGHYKAIREAAEAAAAADVRRVRAGLAAEELRRSIYLGENSAVAGGPDAARDAVASGEVANELVKNLERIERARRAAAEAGKSRGSGGKTELERQLEREQQAAERLARDMEEFGIAMEKSLAQTGVDAIFSFSDALIEGELNFKEFTRNVLQDIAKIIARAVILNALLGQFGGTPGRATGGLQSVLQQLAGFTQLPRFAKGGIVSGAQVYGGAIVGEKGAEAVIPLRRDENGTLGVGSSPINVYNYAGAEVQVERNADRTDIIISQARSAVASDFARSMQTGQGPYARALEGGYRTSRRTG